MFDLRCKAWMHHLLRSFVDTPPKDDRNSAQVPYLKRQCRLPVSVVGFPRG
jgi:hypothetical protein